jgi:sulfotransferase family protein
MSRADSPLRDRMIFNFGAQRSGTLWLQRIVTAHPAVAAVPNETELFSLGIGPLFERFHHGLRSSTTVGSTYVEREVLLDATRDFCDAIFMGHLTDGAHYLAERSPMHSGSVDVISSVYPDARFVHIIRDGRDVARSLVSHDWGPSSVTEAAERWRWAIMSARTAAPQDRYHEVRYEDVLEKPEETIAGLYDFLGVEYSDAVLDEVLAEARVRRNQDARDPTPRREKWRDHFSAEDLRAFEDVAGDLLAELGYAHGEAGQGPAGSPRGGQAPAGSPRAAQAPSGTAAGLRGRVASRLRRGSAGGEAPPASDYAANLAGALSGAQITIDTLLSAIHAGRFDDVAALVAQDAPVRVFSAAGETTGRGPDALVAALRDDPAWTGRQVLGEMHPGVPTYSAVLSFEMPDGSRADRILELGIRKRLARTVTIYKPPLG